jgi:hypothetical protein
MFEAFRLESVFPEPEKEEPVATTPVTERDVSVPTLVMFVWAVESCEAASAPNAMFDAFRFESVFAYTRVEGTIPKAKLEAFRFDRVFAYTRVEGTTPNAKFDAFRFESVLPDPVKEEPVATTPVTERDVSVPTLVILV